MLKPKGLSKLKEFLNAISDIIGSDRSTLGILLIISLIGIFVGWFVSPVIFIISLFVFAICFFYYIGYLDRSR